MLMRSLYLLPTVSLLFATISCRSHSNAAAPTADNRSTASDIAQADQFYGQREDLARLEQGIVLLRQAATNDPNSYEAEWRLAKFNYHLATHTDGEYRDRAFREGISTGKSAVQLQSDKPEGHFWLGANYGGSLESGSFGLATVGDVSTEMKTVLKIDEGYQDGSASMVVIPLIAMLGMMAMGGGMMSQMGGMMNGMKGMSPGFIVLCVTWLVLVAAALIFLFVSLVHGASHV